MGAGPFHFVVLDWWFWIQHVKLYSRNSWKKQVTLLKLSFSFTIMMLLKVLGQKKTKKHHCFSSYCCSFQVYWYVFAWFWFTYVWELISAEKVVLKSFLVLMPNDSLMKQHINLYCILCAQICTGFHAMWWIRASKSKPDQSDYCNCVVMLCFTTFT